MKSQRSIKWLSIAAIVFGVLTVFSGSQALFGSAAARAELGQVVPFVLWFNFSAGFVYVLAGAGLLLAKRWAAPAAWFLAASTVLVSLAFAAHVGAGGAFEMRTAGALLIRSLFWIAVSIVVLRAIKTAPASAAHRPQ